MLPRLLAIPSPSQLTLANHQLQAEVAARQAAVAELEAARAGLEAEVRRRTQELETLARRFEVAIDGSVISLAELDGDLRFLWLHNPRPPFDRLVVGEITQGRLGPDAPRVLGAPARSVLASGEPLRTEVTLPIGEESFSFDVKITPAGPDGRLLIAASDITEQKRQQAHLQVILRELAHRAKNLLSLVDGIARQTARAEDLPVALVDRFSARLAALGDAYDLLITDDWRGVDLAALVAAQLAFIVPELRERVVIDGPAATVRPEVAQYLALALHELATNATKYGALADADGRLSVRWTLEPDETGRSKVRFAWEEAVKAVTPPTRTGFGRSLLERIVPRAVGGEGGLSFPDTGACWRVVFPL
jgi:two-component sensor histidine kinase